MINLSSAEFAKRVGKVQIVLCELFYTIMLEFIMIL